MIAVEGAKLLVALFAVSLLAFAFVPGLGELLTLVKLLAASFGISLLFVLFFPYVRGVKKGDKVQVSKSALSQLLGFVGTAQGDCRVGQEVKVRIGREREAIGVLEKYEGLFTPARVKLMYEEATPSQVMR